MTAENGHDSGTLGVGVGANTPLAGDRLVATVTFERVAAGDAAISFTSAAEIDSAETNEDILSTTSGGTYGDSGPRITGFTPAIAAPAASITISGERFTGATGLKLNGVAAPFSVNSDTQVTATVPAGASSGVLAVTTPTGTITSSSRFLVLTAPTFADVGSSNPFYTDIERLYDLRITAGCGTNGSGQVMFCPNEFVPRQQMAAFLVRAKGWTQLNSPTPTFADVPQSNPFYGYIERLYERGITTGCGTNSLGELIFCPGESVPRQQMAAFLVRAKESSELLSATPAFADVPSSNPFYGWIERLYALGITTGCGTNGSGARIYCPDDYVPRQQMAAFIIRAFA